MSTRTHTYYTVESFGLYTPHHGAEPYWRACGSGPGGNTIEEAQARVRKDITRVNVDELDQVKFVITKTVQVTETVEEVLGAHASFVLLKESTK